MEQVLKGDFGRISGLESSLYSGNEEISIPKTSKKEKLQKVADWIMNLEESYFTPREFEKKENGKFYKNLGVHQFKKFLPSFGNYVNKLANLNIISKFGSKEKGLRNYIGFTRSMESIHLMGLLFGSGVVMQRLSEGDLKTAGYATLANVVANIYPIMVQRYNRARIYNSLEEPKK